MSSLFIPENVVPDLYAYTDGACSGNPGPGGWGVLMLAMEGDRVLKERELCGGEEDTTNNRMELLAAISALDALERRSALTIVTDSSYVKDGLTKWIHGWKRMAGRPPRKSPSRMKICGSGWMKRRRATT